jgi:SM-20-related protein
MQVAFDPFDAERFSFHDHPVLVIEDFWAEEERHYFRQAMQRAAWTSLRDMRILHEVFPNCGNWQKADLARADAAVFLEPCGPSLHHDVC